MRNKSLAKISRFFINIMPEIIQEKARSNLPKLETIELCPIEDISIFGFTQVFIKISFSRGRDFLTTYSNLVKKNFMAPLYGWGSTASRLEPLRGGSLLFTTKFPVNLISTIKLTWLLQNKKIANQLYV